MSTLEISPIELELRKLGLKEKEVKVYLAGLGLGPTSVKNIAQRAKITRPTTYDIIKKLENKELFTEIKQNKKRYFVAQSPSKILGILRIQKREIEEREREFIRIIAALESKYSKEKEEIKTYKGRGGIGLLQESISFTPLSDIFVLSSKTNLKQIKQRDKIYRKVKRRLGKIEVKEIYSKELNIKSKLPYIQRKFSPIPNLKGTLILFDKAIFFHSKKQEGLLIENKLIISLLKSLFSALWKVI